MISKPSRSRVHNDAGSSSSAPHIEVRGAQHVFDLAEQRRKDLGAAPAAEEDTSALEQQLADVNRRLAQLRSIQAKHDELTRLVRELAELAARAKVYEALEWACRRASAESLPGGELIARMASFLKAAGREEVPYIRVETNVCELGWRGDRGDVAVQVLGGDGPRCEREDQDGPSSHPSERARRAGVSTKEVGSGGVHRHLPKICAGFGRPAWENAPETPERDRTRGIRVASLARSWIPFSRPWCCAVRRIAVSPCRP